MAPKKIQNMIRLCYVVFAITGAAWLLPWSTRSNGIKAFRDTAICKHVATDYTPSKLEQAWLDNVHDWHGQYCEHKEFDDQVKAWIAGVKSHVDAKKFRLDNPDIFSSFTYTYQCEGTTTSHKTWIEPLSHGLRHPDSLCGRGADIVDRDYLLLEFGDDRSALASLEGSCVGRKCQALYFDVGASTWNAGAGGPSQSWFIDMYKAHGIEFDRLLLWEAKALPPEEVFKPLPPEMWHKYQYFNMPASTDPNLPSSPVAILKKIAQPGDFVVFKLDIDNGPVENAIIKSIMESPQLMGLIDEFYFEHHVNFGPMLNAWTNSIDRDKTIVDSYKLFHKMRMHGIRAHSWV